MPRTCSLQPAARSIRVSILGLALLAGGCAGAGPADEMEAVKREIYALAAMEHWNAAAIDQALSTRLVKTSDNGSATSLEATSGMLAGQALRAVELRCLNYYPDECLLILELAEPSLSGSEFAERYWPQSRGELQGSHRLSLVWTQQQGRNAISLSSDLDDKADQERRIDSIVIDRIQPGPHPTPEPAQGPPPPLPPPADEEVQVPDVPRAGP